MRGRTFRPSLALVACCLSAALPFAQTNSGDGSARYAAAGQQALAAGRYSEARENYEELAKLEPGVAEVHATLAVIDFKLRDYELAVSEVQTAQRLKPGLPRLDSLLGMAQAELGRFWLRRCRDWRRASSESADAEVRHVCAVLQLELRLHRTQA